MASNRHRKPETLARTPIGIGDADPSQRTEEQASSLQQTAASMEELNATFKSNADTARQASQLASSPAWWRRTAGGATPGR